MTSIKGAFANAGDVSQAEWPVYAGTKALRSAPPGELQIRIDERCRMGRELHDSTSQLLVALQLRLMFFRDQSASAEWRTAVMDIDSTIAALHHEIRSVTAANDSLPVTPRSLPAKLKEMAHRFGRLTDLNVTIECSTPCVPQPTPVATALFRIAQEALANARRHGRARNVQVRLNSNGTSVRMTIDDDGIGLPSELTNRGLGLANARTRVRELGGRFSVRRLKAGTRLAVTINRA